MLIPIMSPKDRNDWLRDIIVPRKAGICSRTKLVKLAAFTPTKKVAVIQNANEPFTLGTKVKKICKTPANNAAAIVRSHLPARLIRRAATKPPKNPEAEANKPKAAPVLSDTEKCILKKVTAYTTKDELIPISTAPMMHAIADLFVKICLKAFQYSGLAKDCSWWGFDGTARKQRSRLTRETGKINHNKTARHPATGAIMLVTGAITRFVKN